MLFFLRSLHCRGVLSHSNAYCFPVSSDSYPCTCPPLLFFCCLPMFIPLSPALSCLCGCASSLPLPSWFFLFCVVPVAMAVSAPAFWLCLAFCRSVFHDCHFSHTASPFVQPSPAFVGFCSGPSLTSPLCCFVDHWLVLSFALSSFGRGCSMLFTFLLPLL